MNDFHCLGSDCLHTCCKNWSVQVDRFHYDAVIRLAQKHPLLNEKVKSGLIPNDSPSNPKHYASIHMNTEGFCPFLNEQRMCDIHGLGGIDILNNTCTFYPRVLYELDQQIEMTGALSCPEVTRLCLTANEDETLQAVDKNILPRLHDLPIIQVLDSQSTTVYQQHFARVRAQFLQLAQQSSLTTKERYYLLCYFSHRLSQYYHLDNDEDIAGLIDNEMTRLGNAQLVENLLSTYDRFEDHELSGLITIQSIFSIRTQHYQDEPLTPYIRDIINSYQDDIEQDPFKAEIEPLYHAYVHRKSVIRLAAKQQIEDYLNRHMQNCLNREWFIRFPDPFVYTQMLVVRQAMLRFLLYSHPSIYRWCLEHQEGEEEVLQKIIEELAIEIFTLFSRSVEHDVPFLQNIYTALETEEMMNTQTSLALLKGV
ncbi:MAG: hypothetical protein HUJ30_05530 [Gammaproteobacteria bacterium]|nr:hypothetical protein [Gammaproteobacteria bacterium]